MVRQLIKDDCECVSKWLGFGDQANISHFLPNMFSQCAEPVGTVGDAGVKICCTHFKAYMPSEHWISVFLYNIYSHRHKSRCSKNTKKKKIKIWC